MTEHPLVAALKTQKAEMTAIRHQIHRNPEVGFEETKTAALVAQKLRELGIEVTEGIARTGVVGTLKGRLPGQRAIGPGDRPLHRS